MHNNLISSLVTDNIQKRASCSSSLLNIICYQNWYQIILHYMDQALLCSSFFTLHSQMTILRFWSTRIILYLITDQSWLIRVQQCLHRIRVTYTSTILAVADRIFFLERSFIVGVDYDAKALIEQCYLDCKLDIRFMTTKALNFARQDKDTRQSLTLKPYLSTQLSLPKKLCKRRFRMFCFEDIDLRTLLLTFVRRLNWVEG